VVEYLLFKDECYKIIGLSMKVHSTLGKGFKEVVYKDALEIEFRKSSILYEREKPFKIIYDDTVLRHEFNADFFVYDSIILEIKAAYQFHIDNFK
jgi:GxxExxY protein